jgi:biotin transporter BioY
VISPEVAAFLVGVVTGAYLGGAAIIAYLMRPRA